MRPFLVCVHDATPAYARETEVMIGDLSPLVGRCLSFGVVPDWHGGWPLASHREYCRLLQEASDELLLHGYFHRRRKSRGPVTLLAEGCDEMNGLDSEETRRTIERGQRVFTEVFGAPARGFLAPAWQPGHVHALTANSLGLEFTLGFFSLESPAGHRTPLSTWTWDCGRWGWLGHVGHAVGSVCQFFNERIPVLAVHPRDLHRGFWPTILGLTRKLLERGCEPATLDSLLRARGARVAL